MPTWNSFTHFYRILRIYVGNELKVIETPMMKSIVHDLTQISKPVSGWMQQCGPINSVYNHYKWLSYNTLPTIPQSALLFSFSIASFEFAI